MVCQWFYACQNEATTHANHPVRVSSNPMPVCERCKRLEERRQEYARRDLLESF